jgi:predicted membrane metal-binding protein
MLRTIAIILLVVWLVSLLLHVTSGLIHLLLLAAIVVFVYDLLVGRRGRGAGPTTPPEV